MSSHQERKVYTLAVIDEHTGLPVREVNEQDLYRLIHGKEPGLQSNMKKSTGTLQQLIAEANLSGQVRCLHCGTTGGLCVRLSLCGRRCVCGSKALVVCRCSWLWHCTSKRDLD